MPKIRNRFCHPSRPLWPGWVPHESRIDCALDKNHFCIVQTMAGRQRQITEIRNSPFQFSRLIEFRKAFSL